MSRRILNGIKEAERSQDGTAPRGLVIVAEDLQGAACGSLFDNANADGERLRLDFLIRTICRADVDVKFILSAGHGVVHDVCCVVVPCECTNRNSNFPNPIQIQAKKKRAEALSFLSADLNQKYQETCAAPRQ